MAHATATTGLQNYVTRIESRRHTLVADEPTASGGQDAGPSPSDLVAAALASCTSITLRMYAERKQWPLQSVRVDVRLSRNPDKSTSIDRVLTLEGDLSDEQRARLADIAERTPVTLTLKNGAKINTTLA